MLLRLREVIIQDGGKGIEQVEAMLQERGVRLHIRAADSASKWQMQQLVLEALRERPRTLRDLALHIAERRPELAQEAAYRRTAYALHRLKSTGRVAHERPVWKLA